MLRLRAASNRDAIGLENSLIMDIFKVVLTPKSSNNCLFLDDFI
jgi:hypothetical protein